MSLWDFINESPLWALVFLFVLFAGIESLVEAWRRK